MGVDRLERLRRRGATLTFEQNERIHSGSGWPMMVFPFAFDGGKDPQGLLRDMLGGQ